MKILTVLLGVLFIPFTSQALCSGEGIYAYPKSHTIYNNSLIFVEGYAADQDIVRNLDSKYPIYLISGDHKVRLELLNTYEGMFSLTMAVLKPVEDLKVGEKYDLDIFNIEKFKRSRLRKWCREHKLTEHFSWTVVEGKDIESPKIDNKPKFLEGRKDYFGCGPAETYLFSLGMEDDSETMVITELKDIESGETNSYIIKSSGLDSVWVGHGMCSGAFTFKGESEYKVRFRPIDIYGNKSPDWTEWVQISDTKE